MSQQIQSTVSDISKTAAPIINEVKPTIVAVGSEISKVASPIVSTIGNTVSTTTSSITSAITSKINNLSKDHTTYKQNLGIIAKYCIIIGLVLLLSCYIMHLISYFYKEKVLPLGIGFFRKFFLIVGVVILCIGIFCAVSWNYYN
jgi:vacuolar-type H+-ATPase subunit I/STV1